jgi:hypothetical protein
MNSAPGLLALDAIVPVATAERTIVSRTATAILAGSIPVASRRIQQSVEGATDGDDQDHARILRAVTTRRRLESPQAGSLASPAPLVRHRRPVPRATRIRFRDGGCSTSEG